MELIEYVKVVWQHRVAVAVITLITVAATFVATLYMPTTYTATSKLRVLKTVDISNLSTPQITADAVDFTVYQQLADDPQFKKETLNAAKLKLGTSAVALGDFDLTVAGIKQTAYLTFSATADSPAMAKALADAGSELLVKKTFQLEYGKTDALKTQIPSRIDLIDKDLAALRQQLTAVAQQTGETDIKKAAALGQIQDQIGAQETSRKGYSDVLSQLALNDLVSHGSLQLAYGATEPRSPASPSWPLNMFAALVVGLMLGAGSVLLMEFSQGKE